MGATPGGWNSDPARWTAAPGWWNSAPAPHGGTAARRSAAPGWLSDAPARWNSAPAASSAAPAANGGGVFGMKSPVSGRKAAPRGESEAVGTKISFIAVGKWNDPDESTAPAKALVGHPRRFFPVSPFPNPLS